MEGGQGSWEYSVALREFRNFVTVSLPSEESLSTDTYSSIYHYLGLRSACLSTDHSVQFSIRGGSKLALFYVLMVKLALFKLPEEVTDF